MKKKVITGKKIAAGDVILGLGSSGLHSNGFSLARTVCFKRNGLKATDRPAEFDGKTLGEVMLEPTRIYVRSVMNVINHYKVKRVVHGMAHITGGGLVGNIPRVLPKDCDALIGEDSWEKPAIFDFIENRGPVDKDEMYRVFNMGIGFVMVVAADFADSITQILSKSGEKVFRLGNVVRGNGKVIIK
jgi:phosphoribosylformylglycinamidine cyclo-ligase